MHAEVDCNVSSEKFREVVDEALGRVVVVDAVARMKRKRKWPEAFGDGRLQIDGRRRGRWD